MKQEDTKEKILRESLKLFSEKGFDATSVGEIASAVGIRAPSLYNHYKSKQAIFDAIFENTAKRYDDFTAKLSVHVGNADSDVDQFETITADKLVEMVRAIFIYSLDDEMVSAFRKMMTIEQFRSEDLAKLYSDRYFERIKNYHAGLFKRLISAGRIKNLDPDTLALIYVSPILTLLSVCDRQPERRDECLEMLENSVRCFFENFNR